MSDKNFVVIGGSSSIGFEISRRLAAGFAPTIRVNAIAPSLTDTRLAKTLLSNDDKRSAAAERHPLRQFSDPRDIAAAAVFLLDDSASWITGQVIAVDGGMGALRTFKQGPSGHVRWVPHL